MEAAQAWGLTPREWRCESIDDRARMMAHGMIKATRQAYAMEKGKDGKPANKPANAYEELKARMRAK
jgi:hypothetical protein